MDKRWSIEKSQPTTRALFSERLAMHLSDHDQLVVPRRAVECRREPFVPDPDRVIYPVDHHTSQRHALAKFEADTRIEVGGQLTRRMIARADELEDDIRSRARDGAHYAFMEAALTTFMADAIEIRHRYMNSETDSWRRS